MADSELNIRVTTTGTASIEEIRKSTRELAKERDKLSSADLEHINKYNAAIREQKERVASLTEGSVTSNGRMMKSYFTLGEQLRRYYMEQRVGNRTLNEVTRTASEMGQMFGMGGLGGVIGNATAQFQQMEFAVSALGIAAKQGTGAVASFGQKLMGWAVPIGVTVAGFGLLKLAIDETSAITERFNQALERNTQLLIKIGAITKEQQVQMLSSRIGKTAQESVSTNWLLGLMPGSIGMKAMGEDVMAKMLDQQTKLTEQLDQRRKLERDIIIQQEEFYEGTGKEINESLIEEKRLRQDILDIQKLHAEWQMRGEQAIAAGFAKRGIAGKIGTGVGLKGLPGAAGGQLQMMSDQISSAQMAANSLNESMSRGFQEATSYLAEGFARAFGLGNSLLDRMISTFATSALMALPDMIANMLTAGATGNIFTALGALFFQHGGMITEPVVGVGVRTGRPHVFAEQGPEYVSPNPIGQAGRYGGGIQQPIVNVYNEVNAAGLSTSVEIGNRMNKRRRY